MLRPAHLFAVLIPVSVLGQSPYPPHLIQDVDWTDGIHNERHSQPVISPGDASLPVSTTGTSTTDFVSGVTVHLTDGFHAGDHSGDGQFHAYIDDGIGSNEDIAIIAPDASHVIDNVLHVEKWEKLEIGLVLPQEYQDAIQRFFDHYYSNSLEEDATTDLIDPLYDLNPYADDSLQLVMTLTKPNGTQTLKWGFYMKEAKWESMDPTAVITGDPNSPLDEYRIRFRFAPDMEGIWQYSIALKAPHTMDPWGSVLPAFDYINYNFVCDPPLPDNKGHLHVNEVNKRTLKFETDEPFFGLGVNMADIRRPNASGYGGGYYYRDHGLMLDAMEQLHEEGGNYVRMYLMRHIFAPEWMNLGVYDSYHGSGPCSGSNAGAQTNASSCQYHCWAFDKMLQQAHDNEIYIQLCVDPYPPGFGFERLIWGNHPFVANLLEPNRDALTGTYDMEEFFYSEVPLTEERLYNEGAFYYWKRKYKYIMSRWGYSVNIAAIEPFNEIDQMLTYQYHDLTSANVGTDVCDENKLIWDVDTDLPNTIYDWLTDITEFVRGNVDLMDPVSSPLGEDKLFLMSYAFNDPLRTDRETFYRPFYNPNVDLLDAHKYMYSNQNQENGPDVELEWAVRTSHDFLDNFPSGAMPRKPINFGECTYATYVTGYNTEIEKSFLNYDVSFHNEIWSGAFSGRFATGTTWNWERVFSWPDGTIPPDDATDLDFSTNNPTGFTNEPGEINKLNIGGFPLSIRNSRLHHHFKPLSELLSHPSWIPYEFFNYDYTTNKVFDENEDLECYYFKDLSNTVAIGWVHNRMAWVRNGYYKSFVQQNFLGCDVPNSTTLVLPGFDPGDYYVSWFSTRTGSSIHPPQMEVASVDGDLILDLNGYFGSVLDNYMDTLRTDYAFIVTPMPFVKSLSARPADGQELELAWDFHVFPNPARTSVTILMPDDNPKEIMLVDISGRLVQVENSVSDRKHVIDINALAKGMYSVRVSDAEHSRAKRILIH